MDLNQQLIFLFSALGSANGLLISGYFLFGKKDKRLSDFFLGGLLLMMSVRIIKSVFLHFNDDLFEVFIQLGLTACFLIGPFLFLYVKSQLRPSPKLATRWWWHILPYIVLIIIFRTLYPYFEEKRMWRYFIRFGIYKQWLIYVLLSGYMMIPIFKKVLRKSKLEHHEFWLVNVFAGTALIYLAYDTSNYTSYLVGAVSFTFMLYISLLFFLFNRLKKQIATDPPLKYARSSLNLEDVQNHKIKLDIILREEKLFLDPELTLSKLSERLGMTSKVVSQVINQSTKQNFSQYIAGMRIEEAQQMLSSPKYAHYKISSIAYDCGFNSLSSFNTYFKKIVGMTAKEFRRNRSES